MALRKGDTVEWETSCPGLEGKTLRGRVIGIPDGCYLFDTVVLVPWSVSGASAGQFTVDPSKVRKV
jgi:hypothetical protein